MLGTRSPKSHCAATYEYALSALNMICGLTVFSAALPSAAGVFVPDEFEQLIIMNSSEENASMYFLQFISLDFIHPETVAELVNEHPYGNCRGKEVGYRHACPYAVYSHNWREQCQSREEEQQLARQ